MRTTLRAGRRSIAVAALLAAATAGCTMGGADPDTADIESPGSTAPAAPPGAAWEAQAASIDGIVNLRQERPDLVTQEHRAGPIAYEILPPVGGPHNDVWMNCQGDVYDEQIPNEHAVHSLEHGAVWVAYRPDLPADQVAALAARVTGTSHLFMSPFPTLDASISLQAWGYQLKVDDAADPRIDEFIRVLRINASPEGPNAPCGGGTSITGTGPVS